MTRFTDKTGFVLNIRMTDNNTGCDFEHDFFKVNNIEEDDNGNYIVDNIDYLANQAKDCWACCGVYADGSKSNAFQLHYCIMGKSGRVYKLFDSDFAAEMANHFDIPCSAVI